MNFVARKHQRAAGFTMLEIALSLAVIGFALVAIVGVLPLGMNVQKENREEALVNQDGPYVLEAMRSGPKGWEALSNYTDRVEITFSNGAPMTFNAPINASNLVGMLTLPRGTQVSGRSVAKVVVHMRTMNGGVVEQGGDSRAMAFAYQITPEVRPFSKFAFTETNFNQTGISPVEYQKRYDRWREAQELQVNLYELGLEFRWPLLPGGKLGNGFATFRTFLSGKPFFTNPTNAFFQPYSFATAYPPQP